MPAVSISSKVASAKTSDSPYQLKHDGVYLESTTDGKKSSTKICDPLRICACTRDGQGEGWGRLLEWRDLDGREHRWTMPQSMLAGRPQNVTAHLLSGGLRIEPNCEVCVIDYISARHPKARKTIVAQTGWYDNAFVLPDIIVPVESTSGGELVYAPDVSDSEHLYRTSGVLDDWRRHVGEVCCGNSRLLFSVSCALSGPTLALLGEESGGFHLFGGSSQGKTTCAVAAGSVWGGGGKNGFLKSWRATSNGLELTAAAHNDLFLGLDELGQLDPKEAVRVAYMLAGGESKQRMNPDGTGQKKSRWQLQFLSTGELTLDQLAASGGGRTRGGMEVRLVNVPVDAQKDLGAFETIHGFRDAGTFVKQIKAAAAEYYGVVGRDFLNYLVLNRDECGRQLKHYIARFEKKYLPARASTEVSRVVRRFAVVAAAGELATLLALTGWDTGEAEQGVGVCLGAWLAQRGAGVGKGHDTEQMIRQVRYFLQSYQGSRFTSRTVNLRINADQSRGASYNKAGYSRTNGKSTVYYFETEVFRVEVCKGYDYLQVLEALRNADHLIADSGRRDKQINVGGRRRRFYAVKDSILDAGS